MKTKLLVFATTILMATNLQAQAPEKFNYQGIARDNTGAPLTNQALGLKISILNPANTPVYVETHSANTNDFGLYHVAIGDGTPVSGTMAGVNWAGGTKKIKVQIDPNGGTNYTDLGTTELLSVPYALYAASAPNGNGWKLNGNAVGNNSFIGTTNNQDLRFKVNNTPAGFIEASGSTQNTALGLNALSALSTGSENTAIGGNALEVNTTGKDNTAVGYKALNANVTGVDNTAIGHEALANSLADRNTAVGFRALTENTLGEYNTASGYRALEDNTTGGFNTATGAYAMEETNSGSYNTAMGYSALESNDTGEENSAFGALSLSFNSTGQENSAFGYRSLHANTTGVENSAMGFEAMEDNTTGQQNTAMGSLALNNNTIGDFNTAVGYVAMLSNTTGSYNTALGRNALGVTTSDLNTAVGHGSLNNLSGSANNNTALGAGTDISDNSDNSTAIGNGASVTGSNKIVFGNISITSIGGFDSFTNLSDVRFKTNMQPLEHGLDFILKLQPITYHYNMEKLHSFMEQREGEAEEPDPEWLGEAMAAKAAIQYTGFSAQQVEQVSQEIGYDFSGVHVPENSLDHYSLAYAEFVVPLVKAIQEQQKIIQDLQKTIKNMQARLSAVENRE